MKINFKRFLKSITPISDEEFEKSLVFFHEKTLKKGELFVQRERICRETAFVNKGILKTFYLNDKGKEITACFCTPNNFSTSYKSFIQQTPSRLSLVALDQTELLVINYQDLQKLYASSTEWHSIGRALAEREFIIVEQYASVLNNDTPKQKYLRLIQEQPEVLKKAMVEDIASYLGVSRRTLSRIRQEISKS